jgi:signal transduction histidine kinase
MCDLALLLTETAELIAPEMRRHNTSVHLELSSHLPKISADRVQIQQVIFNLLYNGLDAVHNEIMERRRITIRSSCEAEWVIFEVEDHGHGISPEIIGNLFDPFFTTKEEGMGIGLNICETIVRDHGGKIGVDSNRYGGATFRVHLPVHREC